MKKQKIKINKNKFGESKAVTLIALVITIIVLLILAGVTIAMLTGENGILSQAQKAKDSTEEAKERENAELKVVEDYLSSQSTQVGEKVQDLISIKEDGIEDTKEDGSKVIIGEKISDGAGGVVPVPNGFYYVGGTVKSGAVISDDERDKNKYKGQEVVGTNLSGNQFVFIPVNGIDLKYEQDHTYDKIHEYAYTSDLSGWTDIENSRSWSDDSGEPTSVKNYGGFFIGRYEAGYPEEIKEGTIVNYKNSATGKVPVSKAGVASWNLVSQPVAKAAAESMYNADNSKVKSKLIDSYAWDTTCKWLKNSGIIKEDSEGKINSTNYGNYYDSTFTIPKGTLYAKHLYLTKQKDEVLSNWYFWKGGKEKYSYGIVNDENGMKVGRKTGETVPENATKPEGAEDAVSNYYTADGRIEIATGSSDNTRTNNIYDLAGNMWEWTTETKIRKNNDDNKNYTFAVMRGGSFGSNGSYNPVVFCSGDSTVSGTNVSLGFRIVLYIKITESM